MYPNQAPRLRSAKRHSDRTSPTDKLVVKSLRLEIRSPSISSGPAVRQIVIDLFDQYRRFIEVPAQGETLSLFEDWWSITPAKRTRRYSALLVRQCTACCRTCTSWATLSTCGSSENPKALSHWMHLQP